MSALVDLPSAIVGDILSNWLFLSNWKVLDTALCSQKLRPQFLVELSLLPVSSSIATGDRSAVFLKWLYLRKIPVNNVSFRSEHLRRNKLSFGVHSDMLTSITIHGIPRLKSAFGAVINSCLNLRSLNCFGFGIIKKVNPVILSGLLDLSISPYPDKSLDIVDKDIVEKAIKRVGNHCKKLEIFHVFCDGSVDEELLDLLRNCSSLHTFHAFGGQKVLEHISNGLSELVDISVNYSFNDSSDFMELELWVLDCFADLIKNRLTIKRLVIQKTFIKLRFEANDSGRLLQIRCGSIVNSLKKLMECANELTEIDISCVSGNTTNFEILVDLLCQYSHESLRVFRFISLDLSATALQKIVSRCAIRELYLSVNDISTALLSLTVDNTISILSLRSSLHREHDWLPLLVGCTNLSKLDISGLECHANSIAAIKIEIQKYRNLEGETAVVEIRYDDLENGAIETKLRFDGVTFTKTTIDLNTWDYGDSEYED